MLRTLETERARGRELFASAGSLEALDAANAAVLGRKSPLGEVQRALGTLEEARRRELGKAVNEALADNPQLLNEDPYGEGWLIEIEAGDMSQFVALLDADGYRALTEG